MKKIKLLLIFTLLSVMSFSQDTIRLKHTNYISVFSKSKHYPVLVEWWVTKSMITCQTPLKRKDNFKPDPLLPEETNLLDDYVKSGFDRGHMCPAADNLCQTQQVQDECFYFSNMSAQYHSLNAGDWKSLEMLVRESIAQNDSIHVWCGNIGEIKKIGKVSVPKYCWKVIYFKNEKLMMAFLFDNNNSKSDGLKNNEVDVEEIEKMTKFKFSKN
jgi:endonuclease G